jgi:hypothetical protein
VITGRFAHWFGNTGQFQLVEAAIGEVGGRLHLHGRLRLRAERLGVGWFTVEQQAYADAGDGGRITRLDLLMSHIAAFSPRVIQSGYSGIMRRARRPQRAAPSAGA